MTLPDMVYTCFLTTFLAPFLFSWFFNEWVPCVSPVQRCCSLRPWAGLGMAPQYFPQFSRNRIGRSLTAIPPPPKAGVQHVGRCTASAVGVGVFVVRVSPAAALRLFQFCAVPPSPPSPSLPSALLPSTELGGRCTANRTAEPPQALRQC